MTVFALDRSLDFPHPDLADRDGLLAVGGDLSPQRLLTAYANGIFPWFDENHPIMWWSPDPRMILYPQRIRITKSLKQTLTHKNIQVTFDEQFDDVILQCAVTKRPGQTGTWITPDMIRAYRKLHQLGYAHSVEVTSHGELIGGLYGISLGRAFFGESMFYRFRDASKIALVHLCQRMVEWEFHFIDAQLATPHLVNMGAVNIPRKEFLDRLSKAIKFPTIVGKW